MCEISVIVPVYNVEDFLCDCLDSIINQTFKDIEIICVNDGSTDRSLEILKDYAIKDSRIRIINQKNQSLGFSRNRGLMEARGKYIYFIDSDDYIDLTTLEKSYNSAINNNSDIVLFKFASFGSAKKEVGFKLENIFGDIDYSSFKFTYSDIKHHVLNSAYSACVKLYKKEFLDSFDDFYFPEKLYFEDVIFHVKVMLRASVISFIPEELYHYRINESSITNSNKSSFDIFKIINSVEDFLVENDFYCEFEKEFITFKIAQIRKFFFESGCDKFFNCTKDEFEKLTITDENTINKDLIKFYKLVLSSNNYNEFIFRYNNEKIADLKKQNKQLKHQKLSSHTRGKNRSLKTFIKKFF